VSAPFCFNVEDIRLQAIRLILLARFSRLVVSMTLAPDRSFRGDLCARPDSYQLRIGPLEKS